MHTHAHTYITHYTHTSISPCQGMEFDVVRLGGDFAGLKEMLGEGIVNQNRPIPREKIDEEVKRGGNSYGK